MPLLCLWAFVACYTVNFTLTFTYINTCNSSEKAWHKTLRISASLLQQIVLCSVMSVFLVRVHSSQVALRNQNSIQEEVKTKLKSGNACYYSVQNLLSSRLLSKDLKTRIYRTIILPIVLYGCETWSLTLEEERRLRLFENRVLRRILVWVVCTSYPISCGW
jgi:hypothetical protein